MFSLSGLGNAEQMDVRAACGIWVEELTLRGCSSRTLVAYRAVVDEFSDALFAKNCSLLEEVTRADLTSAMGEYRSRPDLRTGEVVLRSQASVQLFHAVLRSFFNWCVEAGHLDRSPMSGIRAPKAPARVPKAFPLAACRALVEEAGRTRFPERDVFLVRLALGAGARLSELAALDLADLAPAVDRPTQILYRGKGDRERVVPFPAALHDQLSAYLAVRAERVARFGVPSESLFISSRCRDGDVMGLSAAGMGLLFEALLRRCGLKAPGLRVHVTRHSFATHLLSSGSMDLVSVRELLGHASVATTQMYLKVNPIRLREGVDSNPLL